MFGCLRRVGCLVLIVVIGAAAYMTRDQWYPRLLGRPAVAESIELAVWEAVTAEASASGRRKLARLSARGGPSAVVLQPGELAGVVLADAIARLPAGDALSATVVGDRVYLRGVMRLRDIGGDALGPLAGMLGDRDTLLLGGDVRVLRPGVGEFRVLDARIRDFSLPAPVIRRLVPRLRGSGAMPEGLSEEGLPVRLPASAADLRIAHGQVTLYEDVKQ